MCGGYWPGAAIALVVLSEYGQNCAAEDVAQSLATTLGVVNPKLETHEKIKSVVVLKQAWTIENKLLTPTMKVKRNALENTPRQLSLLVRKRAASSVGIARLC